MERGPVKSDLRGNRTLAAIVFTDGVGFTARMAEDEEHTLNLIRRDFKLMKECCQQFEGQVIKTTGDGLLMYFVSAVQAVACAQAIQKALAEATALLEPKDILAHRIGIHLGDVFFSETDVMGSGVNIAARLQGEADPGGICISQTVYDVVKSHLTLPVVCLGTRPLKNVRELICIYQVLLHPPETPGEAKSETNPASGARLEIDGDGQSYQSYPLDQECLRIGRAPDNDLVLGESFVSRHHAEVSRQGNRYVLTDLGSVDGTQVNRLRLPPHLPHPLENGDLIQIGNTEIRFYEEKLNVLTSVRLIIQRENAPQQEVMIQQEVTKIGRAPDNDIVLSERFVSRYHAQLVCQNGNFTLVDLESTSGTYINQQPLSPHSPQALGHGDMIIIGSTQIQFAIEVVPDAVSPLAKTTIRKFDPLEALPKDPS